eukprot:3622036-Alexandrium_andersonii.AAC.1
MFGADLALPGSRHGLAKQIGDAAGARSRATGGYLRMRLGLCGSIHHHQIPVDLLPPGRGCLGCHRGVLLSFR